MASSSLRQLLLVLLVCISATICAGGACPDPPKKEYCATCQACKGGGTDSSEEDNKCACKDALKDLFEKAKPHLAASDMKCFNVTNPSTCKNCEIEGVHLVTVKEITSSLVTCSQDKFGKCIDHTLTLHVPKIWGKCYCSMHKNPANTAKEMQEIMSKPMFGMKCDAPPEVFANLPQMDMKSLCDPTKFLKEPSCSPLGSIPGASSMPKMGKRNADSERVDGLVPFEWPEVKLTMTIRACEKQEYIVISRAELIEPNPDDLKCTCEGPEEFKKPCKCMMDVNFLKAMLMQGIQMIFPCYCDQATKCQQDKINMLQCRNNYFV